MCAVGESASRGRGIVSGLYNVYDYELYDNLVTQWKCGLTSYV